MAKVGRKPGTPKTGGRKRGTPNKWTGEMREAILEAAHLEGGKEGLVGYLRSLAKDNPNAFASLLGKLLPPPARETSDPAEPVEFKVEHVIVRPPERTPAELFPSRSTNAGAQPKVG